MNIDKAILEDDRCCVAKYLEEINYAIINLQGSDIEELFRLWCLKRECLAKIYLAQHNGKNI